MLPQIAEIKQNPQKKLSGETAESSPERAEETQVGSRFQEA